MSKHDRVIKRISKKGNATERRKSSLSRLEEQLKLGKKPISQKLKRELVEIHGVGKHNDFTDPLKEVDILRIKKEISILKERI